MDVEFSNLNVFASTGFRGPRKEILKGISGKFEKGQLCAILGSSGAGKTTLLNAVSGYVTKGVEGDLLINGNIRNETDFRRRACYITQEDLLPPFMTVYEAMLMAAHLKLPRNIDLRSKIDIIIDILNNLGLEEQSRTRTEKLSGGQKKRFSIALELIANPPVFFLDEPTSGLDNVSASQCIKLLKKLAQQGRTIICTIHQPPTSLLEIFDKCYFVAKGLCVYNGNPGNIVKYLSGIGFHCPLNYNPADYLIELTDGDSEANIIKLSTATKNGRLEHLFTLKSTKIVKDEKQTWLQLNDDVDKKVTYKTSSFYQFWILLQRLLLQNFRNRTALILQALHCAICGFGLGAVYYQNANDGAQMYNHVKFIIGVVLFYSHTHLMIPVLLFPSEVKLVKKEHFNRWYGLTPYFFATNFAKLPTQVLTNSVYTIILYVLSGLPLDVERIFMFIVVGNAVSLASEGMGIAIGSTFNVTNGSVIGPMITAPFLGLACYGFDFSKEIHWFMQLLMKTSPMRCGAVAIVLAVFGFGRKKLQCDELYCHYNDPKVLLQFLDVTEDSRFYLELFALGCAILFYRTLAYLSIRRRFST